MAKLTKHWTASSIADFVYRVASDFTAQLEIKIESEPIERQELAARLDVTPGSVSQFLNNPINPTVRKAAEYARALGMKVALVAYEDGDPNNDLGPISAEVFRKCWHLLGRPRDLFSLTAPLASPQYQVAPGQTLYAGHADGQSDTRLLPGPQQTDLPKAGAPIPQQIQ